MGTNQCRRFLFLLLLVPLAIHKVTLVTVFSPDGVSKNQTTREVTGERERKALVMRTVAPVTVTVLASIYRLAIELRNSEFPYDFWVMVDETANNHTEQLLGSFFAKHGSRVDPPKVFSVSETKLLEAYPKLTSYIYNAPEPNANNETGICCDRPIMWQMFIPTFGLFLNHTRYRHGWSFEDDVGVHGHLTLLDLIHEWDKALDPSVDLAALEIHSGLWGAKRHTNSMKRIVQNMAKASVKWKLYSDTVQRHSLELAEAIVTEVSDNVMQFGERLVFPIAWKHNRSMVSLEHVLVNSSLFGLDHMTGRGKLTGEKGLKKLMELNASPATFLFHEKLPYR